MRRRWRILSVAGIFAAMFVAVPIARIELGCRADAAPPTPYTPLATPDPQRGEARTWLTYPEWHIVYSADSLARHLAMGRAPSAYRYGGDVSGFWNSFCAINRVAAGRPGVGEAKLMIYVIGLSFTAEMAIKALWENSIGRASEGIGGWRTPEDRVAARTQRNYAAFMHEIPWYRFAFGAALSNVWHASGTGNRLRRGERRVALTGEYGVKAGYARALGAATGASLAPDARTLRMVVAATPQTLAAIDPQLHPVARLGTASVVEAPRYARFTDLVGKLATRGVAIREIAGNDDIFVTLTAPDDWDAGRLLLLAMPLTDRPGYRRIGVTLKVPALTAFIARAKARGARLEHVYDY